MHLPWFDEYVGALPAGLDSHPDVLTRGSVVGAMLRGLDWGSQLERLPAALRPWVETPPPAHAWLPEVRAHALFLATGDLLFASDEARFHHHVYTANRHVLGGPVFALLFRLLGPRRVWNGAAVRWGALHRNTWLEPEHFEGHRCSVRLRTPPNHVTLRVATHYGLSMRVALELSGAHGVRVDASLSAPGVAHLVARWDAH